MTFFTKKSLFITLIVPCANILSMEPTEKIQFIDATFMEGDKQVTKKAIYRKNIFEYITGMNEPDFVQQYKDTGIMPPFTQEMDKLAKNMRHSVLTLEELRNAGQKKLSHKNGKLSIIHVDVIKYPDLRHLIDIGAMQGKYPNAVFQTASRPNGLEGQQKPYLPNKATFNGTTDGFNKIIGKFAVQGEEAQISAAVRGIYEIYNTPTPLNFFDQLKIDISPDGNLTNLDADFVNNNDMELLSNLIRVDHWSNVPVTSGYANVLYQNDGIKKVQNLNGAAREKNPEDANVLISHPHLISQVNVTALDVNKNRGKTQELFVKKCGENWANTMDKVAQAALRAAYEGTIYCALLDNKKDVFFTLVGGGSFENKLEWIVDTLDTLKETIKQSGLNINIVVVEINGHLEQPDNSSAWAKLKNLATSTGGTITSNGNALRQSRKSLKSSQ
jgi:hypothetical protein